MQSQHDYRALLSAAPHLKHDCGTTLCTRTVGEISPPRCPHGCLRPGASDRAGVIYCSGCGTRLIGIKGKGFWTEPTLPTPHQTLGLLNSEIYPKTGVLQADGSYRAPLTPIKHPLIDFASDGYDTRCLKDFPITEETKRKFRRLLTWGKSVHPKKKDDPKPSTPDEIAALLEGLWATQVRFFERRQRKYVFWRREKHAPLKPWPKQEPFIGPVFSPPEPALLEQRNSAQVPLGAFPLKCEQAGYATENGIYRAEVNPRFDNFCSKCFTRGLITEHTEGGFKPERGMLMRNGEGEVHVDCFVPFRGKGLDNTWVAHRVFTRQEIRRGLYVPQIHACGERAQV